MKRRYRRASFAGLRPSRQNGRSFGKGIVQIPRTTGAHAIIRKLGRIGRVRVDCADGERLVATGEPASQAGPDEGVALGEERSVPPRWVLLVAGDEGAVKEFTGMFAACTGMSRTRRTRNCWRTV